MEATSFAVDTEEIAASIAAWVRIESPSYDAAAVNRMMDLAADTHVRSLSRVVSRTGNGSNYMLAIRMVPKGALDHEWFTWQPLLQNRSGPCLMLWSMH